MSAILQGVSGGSDWRRIPVLPDNTELEVLPFRLFQAGKGSESMMVLLVRPGTLAFVNGDLLLGGFRVLGHRDEILVACQRFFYSAVSKPVVTTFSLAEGARRPRCVVCRFALEDGQSVVICPQCGRGFHHIDEKKCFTFRPACLCGHPTSLTDEAQWHPQQEEVNHV